MAYLKAPAGAFLLVELETDLDPQQVAGVFRIVSRLAGVSAACDLATIPLELLDERVLLHMEPDERRAWERATRKK